MNQKETDLTVGQNFIKLKFHWDQFPRNFPVENVTGKSPTSYEEVTRKLATFRPSRHVKMVWRRRQQVREEVTGKLVPVEFELNCGFTLTFVIVF